LQSLKEVIMDYYCRRGLMWPDFSDSMKFAATEIGEVYEVDLSRKDWVRNNPQDKPAFTTEALSKELGDVLMMIMVAGIAEGVDPEKSLREKIAKKLEALNV
jgi:NTP pyrophosphatase (non-canonical NTP hydrolase)